MSELLLHEKLRDLAEEYEIRSIAQVRTFTILNRLDAERKASVLIFLSGAGLIKKNKSIIDMMGANLSGAYLGPIFGGFTYELGGENLRGAYLFRANLSKSYLSEADLSYANLVEVNFVEANLMGAILFYSDLSNADLEGANLNKAWVTKDQLSKAKSLKGATMPDGSIHP